MNGGAKEEMTSLRVGLESGRNELKHEIEEVMMDNELTVEVYKTIRQDDRFR